MAALPASGCPAQPVSRPPGRPAPWQGVGGRPAPWQGVGGTQSGVRPHWPVSQMDFLHRHPICPIISTSISYLWESVFRHPVCPASSWGPSLSAAPTSQLNGAETCSDVPSGGIRLKKIVSNDLHHKVGGAGLLEGSDEDCLQVIKPITTSHPPCLGSPSYKGVFLLKARTSVSQQLKRKSEKMTIFGGNYTFKG